MFLNLVKNAAEAVADLGNDGEIQLTTAFRPGVRLAMPGSNARVSLPLEFCVKDNGPGVPDDLMPHPSDPFVPTQRPGTGLGLPSAPKPNAHTRRRIECQPRTRPPTTRVPSSRL